MPHILPASVWVAVTAMSVLDRDVMLKRGPMAPGTVLWAWSFDTGITFGSWRETSIRPWPNTRGQP